MIDGRAICIGVAIGFGFVAFARPAYTDARAILWGITLLFIVLALLFHELTKWRRM